MSAKTARRRRAKNFYECVLDDAERDSVQVAKEVEGIDEEVALLRLRLRTVIKGNPVPKEKPENPDLSPEKLEGSSEDFKGKLEDFALMLRGLDALRRLVEVKFRLGEVQSDAFGEELAQMRDELMRMVREEVGHDSDTGNR